MPYVNKDNFFSVCNLKVYRRTNSVAHRSVVLRKSDEDPEAVCRGPEQCRRSVEDHPKRILHRNAIGTLLVVFPSSSAGNLCKVKTNTLILSLLIKLLNK